MKVRLAVAFSILLVGCAPQKSVLLASSENRNKISSKTSIMTIEALDTFNTSYKDALIHKAFAQSDSGAWAWRANRLKKEQAINDALAKCKENNKKYEKSYPCKVINVNDEWVNLPLTK